MQNVMNVSYDTKIPNNVNLSSDRRVEGTEKWRATVGWWTRLGYSNLKIPMYLPR